MPVPVSLIPELKSTTDKKKLYEKIEKTPDEEFEISRGLYVLEMKDNFDSIIFETQETAEDYFIINSSELKIRYVE